ncbi:MAG TPA: P-II family nitrogen regulator [Bacillota bacterium]
MEEKAETRLEALIVIVDASLDSVIKDLYKQNKLPVYLLCHGYGSAESEIYDLLGFGSPKKVVVLGILNSALTHRILTQLSEKVKFEQPGTGIAFTISLNGVSSSLWKLCQQNNEHVLTEREDPAMELKVTYDLIITIVNRGHSDLVMAAAKKAGATGGTLLHGLGLGSKEAEKFLGITIQPEKDVILVLAPQEKKQAIMETITHEVGLNTSGRGICFSLPVNAALGLKPQA